ncbi:MAG TPA: M56 family metallopeptidase, partial [Candidatus Sulfopaludibacter sp.]|nr:M56 family metallopeptidase [Candidatus Sulfopaludibacter sp.]
PAPSGGSPIAGAGLLQQAMPWILLVWFAGVVACSLRLAGGWISAARLQTAHTRSAPPEWQRTLDRLAARMRIAQTVRLLLSARVETPSVIGWLRPVILAPAGALLGLDPSHIEALLAHELAHIRRHDYLVNVLQGIAESLLFYHPAVWWLSNQVRAEREHCCDDIAVAASGDVLTYARALAELESLRPAHLQSAVAASGGSLARRIRRLIEPEAAPHARFGSEAAWVLGVLTLLAMGGAALSAQDSIRTAPASVERSTIWVDTAKQGDLTIRVRGLGAITSSHTAELQIAETQAKDLQVGQPASIGFPRRRETVSGKVTSIGGSNRITVPVDVQLDGALPPGMGLNAQVDGTITVGSIVNVVYVGRPVFGKANSEDTLFRIEPGGQSAVRVKVQYGRTSVNQIEVKSGLQPGEKVILNDMSAYQGYDRINLR